MTKDNLNYVDVGYIYVLSNVNAVLLDYQFSQMITQRY